MRSQAAVEFLLTYGWAFLVMAAVIGGFVALDPLDNAHSITACRTSGLFGCEEQTVLLDKNDRSMSIPITNLGREAVTIQNVSVTRIGSQNISSQCSSAGRVEGSKTVEIICYDVPFKTEDEADITLDYAYYDPSVGETYAKRGTLRIKGRPSETPMSARGLVGHWRFENTVEDSTPLENHGVVNGTHQYVDGISGDAFSFDGNTYVGVTDDSSLDMPSTHTISAWVKPGFSDNDEYGVATHWNNYGIRLAGKAEYWLRAGGAWNSATGSYPSNAWSHIVATYNQTNYMIYVNGNKRGEGSLNTSLSTVSKPFCIGCDNRDTGERFEGAIDEVRVYNRSLPRSEIQSLYERMRN